MDSTHVLIHTTRLVMLMPAKVGGTELDWRTQENLAAGIQALAPLRQTSEPHLPPAGQRTPSCSCLSICFNITPL